MNAEEIQARKAQTDAVRQQTEEMRRQREQREREFDPAIRVFRENRYQYIKSGGLIDEQSLGIIVWWITVKSAWGRWQAAMHGLEETTNPTHLFLQSTASHLTTELEQAKIVARAYHTNDSSYKELSPDFWRRRYLRIVPDSISIWKVLICLRGSTDLIEDGEYSNPICDWNDVKLHFPEADEKIDAITASLRAGNPSKD